MTTSTFGRRMAFRPTPSTCYPPPPPPPLPYDVPCLKGTPGLQLKFRTRLRFYKGPPHSAVPFDDNLEGFPTAGMDGPNKCWTINLSDSQNIIANFKLVCAPGPFGTGQWQLSLDGIAIMPDGTFLAWTGTEPWNSPIDLSVPTGVNDIVITDVLHGSAAPDWSSLTHTTQFFTAGAPDYR